MKILIISDLHSDRDVLKSVGALLSNESFDLAILPGDITNREPNALRYANDIDTLFNNHQLNYLMVHGNNDPPEVIEFFKQRGKNLHYKPINYASFEFFGVGGWGDELPPYKLCFSQKSILVTHIPPHTNPKGNKQAFKNNPLIHISGHLHQKEKVFVWGETIIINTPGLKDTNRGGVLDLPSKSIYFFKLPNKVICINKD